MATLETISLIRHRSQTGNYVSVCMYIE